MNFRISHSASSVEALTGHHHHGPKRWFRASSAYKHVLACPLRKPNSSKKPPCSDSQFWAESRVPYKLSLSSPHCRLLVLLRLLPEARCRLCASPSHRSTLFARQSPRALSPSDCLTLLPRCRASPPPEVTLHWTSRAWVQCCIPSRPQRDLMFGHTDVPLFVSAQPVLMEFFPVSFQHWLMGTFSCTACFFTNCISSSRAFRTKTGSNHPSLASSQYFPSRIEFSSCTICPPSLLRLCFFRTWGVKSRGLACVSLAMCIAEDAWSASPICCRRPSQISESRFSRRLVPSTFLAIWGLFVKKLTRSPSPLSLALPSAWKTSCLHSNRIMHGRRELRSIATEVVQEPGSSPDLLMVQDCTEQYAFATSNDKLRVLLADQPQNFALIFPSAVHWKSMGPKLRKPFQESWRTQILGLWLAPAYLHRKWQNLVPVLQKMPETSYCIFVLFKDTLVGMWLRLSWWVMSLSHSNGKGILVSSRMLLSCHFNPQVVTYCWRKRKQRRKGKPSSSHLSIHSGTIQTTKNLATVYRSREKYTTTASGSLVSNPNTRKGTAVLADKIWHNSVPADCIYKVISQKRWKNFIWKTLTHLGVARK